MRREFTFLADENSNTLLGESFEIPQACERCFVEIETKVQDSLMGYVILKDEEGRIRLQKLIGYGSRCMCIGKGPEDTSTGGVPGAVNAGRWEINVCIFKEYVSQQSGSTAVSFLIRLTDTISKHMEQPDYIGGQCWVSGKGQISLLHDLYDWEKIYKKESRWYKGDFHTHTCLSDGKETVNNAMKKAEDMGMDFYVPTEHNVIHTGWPETNIMVVPGVEVTTKRGHCNLFGIDKLPRHLPHMLEDMEGESAEKYMELIWQEAKEREWKISINHPFLHIWKWEYKKTLLRLIDFIEIVNDPTYPYAREANAKAIRFLDRLWQDGYKIYGIGGSDSHNLIDERYDGATEPSVVGDPGTYVYVQGLTPRRMLKELEKGHVYVSRHCTLDLNIYTDDTEYLPGDEVVCRERTRVRYQVKIKGLKDEPQAYMVINRVRFRMELRKIETDTYEGEAQIDFDPGVWMWVRLDVKDDKGDFAAYVNPVYSGEKEHKMKTWQEAVCATEEEEHD